MTARPPEVGVVVPTRNSARTLRACLESLRCQSLRPTIVVVDNYSTDSTAAIAQERADIFVVAGPERSAQRNHGVELLGDTSVAGFVDSDMVAEAGVVSEAVECIRGGAGAVVVPEHTMGTGFVAKVRAFERALYVGAARVEAARFFRRDLFQTIGGFDEMLNAGEDWDLALRVTATGTSTAHITARIWHDEAHVGYFAHCAKKGRYADGLRMFLEKHGDDGRSVLLDRPYLHRPWVLLRHPLLGAGLITVKSGEAAAVLAAVARERARTVRTKDVGLDPPPGGHRCDDDALTK